MEKYKIKTLNHISEKGLELLTPDFLIDQEDKNPQGILVRSADLHDYNFSPETLYIGRAGAGVNNIPLEKCSEQGIVVCNAPRGNANAVKELTATALLLSSRKIVEGIEWVKTMDCQEDIEKKVESGKKNFAGPELLGKKLGVIGLGATGQLVAKIGLDFGMKVYGHDPYISLKNALHLNSSVKYVADIRDIFRNCDYVSLHIPKTKETENIISRELLSMAKRGLRLINISRGGLVEFDALKEFLENGTIEKYVVDFPDSKSLILPNTINIPHLGASTPESEENSARMVVEQMIDYITFGNIRNSVNFPDSNMGPLNSLHRITINHRNRPNMIGQISTIVAEEGINISNLLNRHKGDWAYTMIDLDNEINQDFIRKLRNIDGVTRVRLVK